MACSTLELLRMSRLEAISVEFQRRGPIPLAMSSSSSHIQPNGHAYGAGAGAHYGHHLAASPAVSSASSVCSSSEMNLSQELQNHPLFKTPAVDRSVSSLVRAYELRLQQLQ